MAWVLVVILLFVLLIVLWPNGKRDDTDPPNEPSGLELFIDNRTGCHYLGTPDGGITARLDAKGKQICEPKVGSR